MLWGSPLLSSQSAKEVIRLEDDGRPMYHLTLLSELHGQEVQNGYYFIPASSHTNPDNALDCFNIVERFNARIMPAIRDFANNELHFIGLICATVIPQWGVIYERGFETGEGIQPDESLHSTAAGVLSLRTGLGGRSHIGRSYYGGVSKADSQQSRLSAGSHTRLQTIGNALLDGFGASIADNEFHYGVYSHKLGDVPRDPPAVGKRLTLVGFTPITNIIARHVIGTQRHRIPRTPK
jgi:hypothetical protein